METNEMPTPIRLGFRMGVIDESSYKYQQRNWCESSFL